MTLVILRRVLGVAAGLALGVPLIAAWQEPAVATSVKLTATALLFVTAVRPAIGLCAIAGLLPMAFAVPVLARIAMNGTVIGELLTLGFLSGAVLRLSFSGRAGSRLAAPALILGALAAASGVVLLSGAQTSLLSVSSYLANLAQHVAMKYFVDSHDFGDLHLAVTWLEAIGLAVAAEAVIRREPRVGRLAVSLAIAGAAVLAFFSANRLYEVAMRSAEPFATAWRVITTVRFNPFYTDVNAAGSLYALFVVPALWAATFGRQRVMWLAAALLSLACWLAGSRAALLGVAVGFAAAWIVSREQSRKQSWWAVAGFGVVALAVVIPSMSQRGSASVTDAMSLRQEMARVSLRMTAVDPVFGVGLGRFRPSSRVFMSPSLAPRYPFGENAHNNYLQILAELGPFGVAAFLWMLGATLRRVDAAPATASGAVGRASLAAGAVGGIVAFAISALAGHPLLNDHIRLCFFLVVGLAAGVDAVAPSLSPTFARLRKARTVIVLLVVAFIAISLPWRVKARRDAANLDAVVLGASTESEGPDGMIYRIAEREASWFVSGTAKAVEVPVRSDATSKVSCTIRLEIDGRAADVVTAPGDAWRLVPIPLTTPTDRRSRRVSIYSPDGCRLMVGRLVVHD